jgi:hypothetical protein
MIMSKEHLMRKHLLFISLLLLFLASCGEKLVDTSNIKMIEGSWGHLSDDAMSNTRPSPMYLYNLEPGQTYKVCLSKEISETIPGVEEEVIAAINIWAHYIGREIPVEISIKDIPAEFTKDQVEASASEITDRLKSFCESDTHLVIALVPMEWPAQGQKYQNGTLGYTSFHYSIYESKTGKHQVESFSRGLFLRRSLAFDKEQYKWKGISELRGKKLTAKEILDLMINRKNREYMIAETTYSSLAVLTHEFGHVWGLCDMYKLTGSRVTNCDPNYAITDNEKRIILQKESIMTSRGFVTEHYLFKDDVEGIRHIAERYNYNLKWPAKNEIDLIPILPTEYKKIEIARIAEAKEVEESGVKNVSVTLNLIFTVPIETQFTLIDENGKTLDYLPTAISDLTPYGQRTNNFELWGNTHYTSVRVTIKPQGSTDPNESIVLTKDIEQW